MMFGEAKVALELCLRPMNMGDRFDICRSGSTFEVMNPEPLICWPQDLERALASLRQMDADLGATEMYAPLKAVLERRPILDCVRQIVLRTDGQVSNVAAVLEPVGQHRKHNRIFSSGVGAAPSSHLVRGFARASHGAAEFIAVGERRQRLLALSKASGIVCSAIAFVALGRWSRDRLPTGPG
jgi:hypothetical protein